MGKSWIQSLGNKAVEPLNLQPEMVGDIEEIAHALSGNFRFTRQTRQRYTVAEHCVRGSRLLPAAFAGAFLLHELSEVYLPDIAGPIKPHVSIRITRDVPAGPEGIIQLGTRQSWEDLEQHHTRTVLTALGLASIEPLIYAPEVKAMDFAMLAAEKAFLCGTPPEPWLEGIAPADAGFVHCVPTWSPDVAKDAFVTRFAELFKDLA